MKHKLFTLLFTIVTSIGMTSAEIIERVYINGLYYNLDTDNNTAKVINNRVNITQSSYPDLVSANIPESVTYMGNAYTVTSIGSGAFQDCSKLTIVNIPNSVTTIYNQAFFSCPKLNSVTFPNSIVSIGGGVFNYCDNLNQVVYNTHIFAHMPTSYNGTYTIPDNVESIAADAFYRCSNITSVTIPNSVTSIGSSAFYNCKSLASIEIPNSVTSIGIGAFYYCSSLKSITIPNSVTSIGKEAFKYTGLTTPVYNAHVFAYMPHSYSGTYIIPDGIETIADGAFSGCTGLTSITIPNSVTSIGESAFSGCGNLTSVDIPNNITSIGENAFLGVSNINYSGYATGAPWGALALNGEPRALSVSEIKTLASNLGYNETSQDYYRFTGVISSINEVNTTYGNATFNITDGVNTFYCYRIHDYHSTLFTSSDQLNVGDSVVISSKVQNYKGTTPEATQGRLVYHSANPLFTPDSIFYYGHRKNYPGELKLYEAIDIDTLDIPSAVSYNGQNYTVTEMASGAFYNKSNLKCIKLPKTLKLMPRAFEKCSNIQSLYFNAKNLEQQTTIPFAESNSTLRTIHIGENVSSLPHEFFNNLTNITSVYWNAIACYDMHYSPFYYSRNSITDFIIANNIEYIPANMCWGMTNLTEFKIPSSVTAIGKDAFHGCTSLTSLSLGENITSYGDSVFAGCSALTSIYNYRERPAQLSIGTFDGIDYFNCTLYVPEGSVDMYKSSGSDWKDFYFVEPLPAEVIDSHLEYDAEDVDFIVDFDSYELDASTLANGYSWLTAVNEKRQVIQMLMVFPSGKTELVAGTYPVEATGIFQSVYAGQGLNEQGNIIGSFACNIDNEGYVIDPFWYLVSGTVIVDVDGNIDVDAVNSYNRTIRCHLRKASEAVEDITAEKANGTIKHLRDGQVLILRGDKTYTLQGQEVK